MGLTQKNSNDQKHKTNEQTNCDNQTQQNSYTRHVIITDRKTTTKPNVFSPRTATNYRGARSIGSRQGTRQGHSLIGRMFDEIRVQSRRVKRWCEQNSKDGGCL